jgi:hypothetical protein
MSLKACRPFGGVATSGAGRRRYRTPAAAARSHAGRYRTPAAVARRR